MGILVSTRTFLTRVRKSCFGLHFYQPLRQGSKQTRMSGRFRSFMWDPRLIISQMIATQCIFYITLGLLTGACLAMAGFYPALRYIFDWQSVHFHSRENQIVIVIHVLNSLFGAIALWYVIQRAKQCLDFACTLHLYHLIACWAYSGYFPASVTWWLVQLVCIVLMVVIGEYLCFRSAMKDIPLMGARTGV